MCLCLIVSDSFEVVLTSSVEHVLLDLLVGLWLKRLAVALLDSLGMRCLVYDFVVFKEIANLFIDNLLSSLAPTRWPSKLFHVLSPVPRRWSAMSSCCSARSLYSCCRTSNSGQRTI